jgi:hypothetical protein
VRFATIGILLSALALSACQGVNYSRAYGGSCVPRAYEAGLCNDYSKMGPVNPPGGTVTNAW